MADHLGSHLDQVLPQRGQRPMFDRLGQCQGAHEIGEIVGQRDTLLPNCSTSAFVKGCRTPAVSGCLRRTRSVGVGQASGEETVGRCGWSVPAAMGIVAAAGWLPGVAWSVGSRGCGRPRHRRGGFATTWRWRWRVLSGDRRARRGLGQSGAVAGGGGRHPWSVSKT